MMGNLQNLCGKGGDTGEIRRVLTLVAPDKSIWHCCQRLVLGLWRCPISMVTTGLSVADVLGLLECRLGVDGVRLDGKDDMQMHCLQKAGHSDSCVLGQILNFLKV